ncbi:MAG: hydrogenase maturation nickel metallochaperone HypA [Dehalococcoidia bacterium]
MAIARSIVDIAVAAARRENATRVVRVNVLAGELRAIIPAQLILYFGLMSRDTPAQGAHLGLDIAPLVGRCPTCSQDFSVKDCSLVCPVCCGQDVEIVSGTELRVKDIEVE